jgi:hypothetical protein
MKYSTKMRFRGDTLEVESYSDSSGTTVLYRTTVKLARIIAWCENPLHVNCDNRSTTVLILSGGSHVQVNVPYDEFDKALMAQYGRTE